MKKDIYTSLIKEFCFEDFCFENIRIEKPDGMFKTVKRDFDLIIFNAKKIIFVAQVDNDINRDEIVLQLRAALNSIVNKLSLSLNDFIVCGANDKNFYFLNKYNDRLIEFDFIVSDLLKIVESVENELSYSSNTFNYDLLKKLKDALVLSASTKTLSNTKEKVKYDADGKAFINKHGVWREASDINTETLYSLTVFGGMFGIHQFYQKKKLKGVLYFLTFGLFGLYILDCIEILLGIYKDPDGRYCLPLENKLAGLLKLVLGVALFFVLALVSSFLVKLLTGSLSNAFMSLF